MKPDSPRIHSSSISLRSRIAAAISNTPRTMADAAMTASKATSVIPGQANAMIPAATASTPSATIVHHTVPSDSPRKPIMRATTPSITVKMANM